MFSRKGHGPISIGSSLIPESSAEKLVGFYISKDMTWKPHLQALERDLRCRIGILRRLSWHLSKPSLISCLNPVFMSKLQGGLELFTDSLSHQNPNLRDCPAIYRLQVLQNEAMRVVLRKRVSDKMSVEQLLNETRQSSVATLALRATYRQSWNFFSTLQRRRLFNTSHRLDKWGNERATRQNQGDTFPEQDVRNSLLSRLCKCWNDMSVDLKATASKYAVKAKLKQIFK